MQKTENKKQTITGDMLIGEIVQKYPLFSEVAAKYGLHCAGCHFSPMETVENGSLGHGMEREHYEMMLNEVNEKLAGVKPIESNPDGVTVTAAAHAKLKEVIAKQGKDASYGLRVKVTATGNGLLAYDLSFDNQTDASDKVFEDNNLKVFVDAGSLALFKGSTIDYVDTGMQAGLKINNPHATSACGCGHPH